MRVAPARFVWRAALVSFLLSILAVALAIPTRWEGHRTAESAWVPLRPLSVPEAVTLLALRDQYKLTALLALTDDEVYLGTSYYLLPPVGSPRTKPVEGWEVSVDGRRHAMYSATWEPYYLVHRLPRRDLEVAFGRQLSPADVTPAVFDRYTVSYRSYRLWLYALVEIGVLTGFLAGLAVCLRKLRHPLLVAPLLLLTEALLLVVAWAYAPTLHDADSFYQRILLDRLADWGLALTWLGNPLVVGAVCLGLYGVDRLGHRFEAEGRFAWGAWRRRAAAAAAISLVAGDYREYVRERESARTRIAEAIKAVPPARLADLVHWAAATGCQETRLVDLYKETPVASSVLHEIDAVLGGVGLQPEQRVTVIVQAGRCDLYLTAGLEGTWRYADLRPNTASPAYGFDTQTASDGEFSRSYWTHPCRSHVERRMLRTTNGNVALIELEYAREYRGSLLRQLCHAAWWGD